MTKANPKTILSGHTTTASKAKWFCFSGETNIFIAKANSLRSKSFKKAVDNILISLIF